jgi:hypothetical protein
MEQIHNPDAEPRTEVQERRHIGRRDRFQETLCAGDIDGVEDRRCQGVADRRRFLVFYRCFH